MKPDEVPGEVFRDSGGWEFPLDGDVILGFLGEREWGEEEGFHWGDYSGRGSRLSAKELVWTSIFWAMERSRLLRWAFSLTGLK